MEIFTVHDSKAEAFLSPFFCKTVGLAIRSFTQAANDQGHDFNKYAADYTLFHLGAYDESTATFELFGAPKNIGIALQFIENDS